MRRNDNGRTNTKIELILIETGQHDLKFKLGEIIKYSPKEVGEILRKHKDELRQMVMKSMNNKNAVSEYED